jgi:tetratricopeptide (TPR) repeat protein
MSIKLSENAYNFAQKLLKIFNHDKPIETGSTQTVKNNEYVKEENRIIGKTDYKKYEELAKNVELDEIKADPKTKEVLKMGCNNDLRKERQMMDKPSIYKIEAAKLFKNEGDEFLKNKQYSEAINSYEKGLLQLFYTFSDDPEEDKQVETIKASLNMNMSMCLMNINKFEEAIGQCSEALRIDKNNLKAIYRIAFSYFKLDKYDESKKFINDAFKIQPDSTEFKSLLESIKSKEKENEDQSKKLFRKIKLGDSNNNI